MIGGWLEARERRLVGGEREEARERRLVGGEKRGRETFLKGFVVSDKVCHRCFGGEDWTERVWTAHVARCNVALSSWH